MYCKNCGQKLIEGDKFCGSCGGRVDVSDAAETALGENPFSVGGEKEAAQSPASPTEDFNWNIHTFPGQESKTTTEDPDFNWTAGTTTPSKETDVFSESNQNWDSILESTKPVESQPSTTSSLGSLEDDLFGGLKDSTTETKKQAEEIDKFFTFNKKNEEFQQLLDKEYEKVKTGNILEDELDTASALSEERFATRKPEDPMEDLFASEGIIKGYQPKEVETSVLDRIDAADAERQARVDAAQILEEERAKAAAKRIAEEEAQAQAKAETDARVQADVQARAREEAAARMQAEAQARAAEAAQSENAAQMQAEAEVRAKQENAARIQAEAQAKAQARARAEAEAARAQAAAQQQQPVDPVNHISEMANARETFFAEDNNMSTQGQEPVVNTEPQTPPIEDIDLGQGAPTETIRAVDKAAILAGMASATKMVETDKAVAEQTAEEQPGGLDLPDFLGHLDDTPQQQPEQPEELPMEQFIANQMPMGTEEAIESEIPESSLERVFETAVQPEETATTILGAEEEQEDNLFGVPEELDNSAATGILVNDDDNTTESSGKGRIVLKVLLVILIILLTIEVAGVLIKIIAPTSKAATMIDKQLTNVIHFFTGDNDKQYSAFAEPENIRDKPLKDITPLINSESDKNKDNQIKSIVYNKNLELDPDKKYPDTQLIMSQSLMDVTWYKDASNEQVYYDQAIVGTLIAFESQKMNKINFGDSSVLNLITEKTSLYKNVKKMGKSGTNEKFNELQIGEIRQAGESYYVWVSEKITTSGKATTTDKVYELKPEDKTMKVSAEIKI